MNRDHFNHITEHFKLNKSLNIFVGADEFVKISELFVSKNPDKNEYYICSHINSKMISPFLQKHFVGIKNQQEAEQIIEYCKITEMMFC